MQLTFAEHFFQTLSYALLNSIWQMALLWFLFLSISYKKENHPQAKFIFLVVFQIIGFIWFLQTFTSSYVNHQTFDSHLSITFLQNTLLNNFLFFTGVLYLVFVIYHIVQFFIGVQSIVDISHQKKQGNLLEYDLFLQQMSKSLGIAKQVCLRVSNKIATPLTIGVIKPIILIPIAAINSLSPAQMEAIILHELAHIKRKDYLINLLLLIIDVFMFFNPFSKLMKKQIFFERELCCDDIVLHHQLNNSVYANALLNIASLQLKKHSQDFALNAVAEKNDLLKRIQRILGLKYSSYTKTHAFFTLLFCLFIGLLSLSITTSNQEKSVVKKSTITQPLNLKNEVVVIDKQLVKSTKHPFKKQQSKYSKQAPIKDLDENQNQKNNLVETLNYFKPIENQTSQFAYHTDENEINTSIQQEPITISSAFNKYPIVTTQKFFIPATAYKPASIIIVTTTETELGKKVVQIDIVKGNGTVE
jgi:bla regulator protein blaR1